MNEESDATLVQRARNGDGDAFAELMRRHAGMVYAIAYAQLLDASDAEDIVQDTFIRVYSRIGQLRTPDRFRAWIARIAYSASRDARVRRKREPRADVESLLSDAADPASPQQVFEREQDIRRLLDAGLRSLPATLRMPLVMRYMQDASISEIAETLAMRPAAVRMRISRARSLLRSYLNRSGVAEEANELLNQ